MKNHLFIETIGHHIMSRNNMVPDRAGLLQLHKSHDLNYTTHVFNTQFLVTKYKHHHVHSHWSSIIRHLPEGSDCCSPSNHLRVEIDPNQLEKNGRKTVGKRSENGQELMKRRAPARKLLAVCATYIKIIPVCIHTNYGFIIRILIVIVIIVS